MVEAHDISLLFQALNDRPGRHALAGRKMTCPEPPTGKRSILGHDLAQRSTEKPQPKATPRQRLSGDIGRPR